jgi:hypothetical protein
MMGRASAVGASILALAGLVACGSSSGTRSPSAATGSSTRTPVPLSTVAHRAAHTASQLPDGSVLVAGGCIVNGCATATADTFVIAPDGRSAARGPAMSSPRDNHTASVLPDGSVVVVGGFGGEGAGVLASIDLLHPRSTEREAVGHLLTARGGHAAATLLDGRLLVVGGWVAPHQYTASVEVIDPRSWAVERGADLPWAADALDGVALVDGRVLVTGGQVRPGVGTSRAALFDPATSRWELTGPMATPRFKHFSVPLADGRVLVMGGTRDDEHLLATTEVFDPATGRFSPGPTMSEPRYKLPGGAALLPDGRVLVAGGGRNLEVLDVDAGTSRVLQEAAHRASFATVTPLGTGDVLVLGGYDEQIRLNDNLAVIPRDALT